MSFHARGHWFKSSTAHYHTSSNPTLATKIDEASQLGLAFSFTLQEVSQEKHWDNENHLGYKWILFLSEDPLDDFAIALVEVSTDQE